MISNKFYPYGLTARTCEALNFLYGLKTGFFLHIVMLVNNFPFRVYYLRFKVTLHEILQRKFIEH